MVNVKMGDDDCIEFLNADVYQKVANRPDSPTRAIHKECAALQEIRYDRAISLTNIQEGNDIVCRTVQVAIVV
jgi:hypothetical protein